MCGAEIALARSAAPSSISSDAAVLVLTPRGYVTAAEGKNGFVCFVDRSWSAWGANLPSSPVLGGGQDLPGGGRMPWTIFFVPISRWSDGTPADEHPGAHK